ncbi:MAG TPA: DUF6134 family protein [Rhizomicrobium sp.]|jgi:hypothetical protein
MQVSYAAVVPLAVSIGIFGGVARAGDDMTTLNFAVMRNGAKIGTNSISFGKRGPDETVQTETHVAIGFGFLTIYKFDQSETELWTDGRLVKMNSTTDDNGTVHRSNAVARDDKLVVKGEGAAKELAPTLIPLSLWNSAVTEQSTVIDPRDGTIVSLKVADRGDDELVIHGRPLRTHHYEITTTFPQDVWYDENHRLVQVELKGSDGSTIRYQLV